MIKIRQYIDRSGRNPFDRWFQKLNDEAQARITIALDRLEHENFSATKGVGGGVFELRLDFGPGYRVYFGKDGDQLVILVGGGTKKRQQSEIEAAQSLWNEYKEWKRGK